MSFRPYHCVNIVSYLSQIQISHKLDWHLVPSDNPIPKRMLLFIASQERRFSWCFLAMHWLFCCAHLLQFFALFFECINSSVVHIPCSSIGECTPNSRNNDLHCKFFYEAWSMNLKKILVSAVKMIFLYAYDLFRCTPCWRIWYGAKIIRNMGM